jgi:hypothetical protein
MAVISGLGLGKLFGFSLAANSYLNLDTLSFEGRVFGQPLKRS